MRVDRVRKLLEANHACIRIVTHEEPEAMHVVTAAATDLGLEPWVWSAVDGLRHARLADAPAIEGTENPGAALYYIRKNITTPCCCVLLDMAQHLDDPRTLRAWRDLIEHFRAGGINSQLKGRAFVVMIDHTDKAPSLIDALSVRHMVSLPDDEEIHSILKRTLRGLNARTPIEIDLKRSELDAIVRNLRGLSRRQAEQIVAEMVTHDRKLTAADIDILIKSKRTLLQSAGTLEFVDSPRTMDEIGGLTRLKSWLKERERSFEPEAQEFGLTPPRGVLLLGVQGAGKSLSAKAIATAWKRPLMKLDPGTLYDRYVGESERRLREALRQAEAMAPVILWIDEIEKGFASAASQSTDGGLSQRMFGALLNWMQEHTAPVFLVATANNIEALPPELLRKGRFDEIFFVDLPSREARRMIFEIHLKKRKKMSDAIDLDALADASEGFSGAEIEQAVLAALHRCFSEKTPVSTECLVDAVKGSPPLSVTMAERIERLRRWADGRCVPAE